MKEDYAWATAKMAYTDATIAVDALEYSGEADTQDLDITRATHDAIIIAVQDPITDFRTVSRSAQLFGAAEFDNALGLLSAQLTDLREAGYAPRFGGFNLATRMLVDDFLVKEGHPEYEN